MTPSLNTTPTHAINIAEQWGTVWAYEQDGPNHYATGTTPAGYVVTLCIDARDNSRAWSVGKTWRDITERQAFDIIRHSRPYWRGDANALAMIGGTFKPPAYHTTTPATTRSMFQGAA